MLRHFSRKIKGSDNYWRSSVGTLNDEYIRKVPLPQAPWIQHASQSPVETIQNVPVNFGSKVRHV